MKNLIVIILTAFIATFSTKGYATHAMGADITYTCDSAYTYTFKLVYYRYCGGVPFSDPSSLTKLVATSTGTSYGVTLTRQSIAEVTPLCKTEKARCNPPNTSRTGDGIEAHTYTVTIDFKNSPYSNLLKNGNCEVRFETGQCCRNSNITTGAANQNFYTYALINLCQAPVNNSPQFLYPPMGYLCCNQPSYSSVGGYDLTDFDSLSYAFANPLRGFNNKVSYSGNYAYNNPFKAYYPTGLKYPYNNPNANPPIGIYLDEANGSVIWTPTQCDEITVAVLEIIEWRKDTAGKYQKIGLTRRDMQYITKQCPENNPPNLKGNKTHSIKVAPCLEEYCFTVQSFDRVRVPPPPAKAPPADTVSFVNPTLPYGVSFNIINPKDTNPAAEICIDLTKVNLNKLTQHPLVFPITIRDNACPLNAVSTYVYRIVFDTTTSFGKLRGATIDDRNANCVQNTGEDKLEHIRKVALSKQGFYQHTESNGTFEFCLDTGTTIAKLMDNPWFQDQCASDTRTILKDSVHSIEFFSKLKDGIGGYVYTEARTCKIDSSSTPIRGQMVMAQPGDHYTITDKNGYYLFNVDTGNYTLSLVNDTNIWENRCTKSIAVSLKANETKQIDTFINYHKTVTDLDVKIGFSSGETVRKGTDCYANLVVSNKGHSVIDSAIITVQTYTNIATLAKSHKSWISLGSGKYQTTIYNLLPLVNKRVSLYLATKTGFTVGNKISFIASSDSLSTKNDFNNVDTAILRVVAPYDPNIKTATPYSIFTVDNRRLTYIVEFQNEGTASALDVIVRDSLSDLFDLSTLQVHYGSHEFNYVLEGSHLWFQFDEINLPPKSVDEAGSIGSVTFSIALKSDIYEDKLVKNRVGIYFDTEDVVLTDYQINHFKSPIEFTSSLEQVYCTLDTISLPFIAWFTPDTVNTYILEMTDSSGDLSTFAPLDSIESSNSSETFKLVVQNQFTLGSKYRFRIKSTQMVTEMFTDAYSKTTTIESVNQTSVISSDTVACYGSSIVIKPSEDFYDNTLYLNGKPFLTGSNIVYTTDSLEHQDHVYFEHQTKLGCITTSDTVYYEIRATPTIALTTSKDTIFCYRGSNVTSSYALKHSLGVGSTEEIFWNFGDNTSTTTDASVTSNSHIYDKGKYEITITAVHGQCTDSAKTSIYVGVQPTIDILSLSTGICPKEVVTASFQSTAQLIFALDSTIWNYSDGSTYTVKDGSTPNHKFVNTGQFTVKIIQFSAGCSDTASGDIKVVLGPRGTITASSLSECLPQATFTFTSAITGDYKSSKWVIEGNEYTTDDVTKAYATVGQKAITLIVAGNSKCSDTSSVTVDVYEKPNASFELNDSNGYVVEIKNTSIGNERNYWTIDTIEIENNDASFEHTFWLNGKYVIQLITESAEGCLDTIQQIASVDNEIIFYVPNTFSPNKDRLNETFNILPKEIIHGIELTIYDRFGVMVSESKDKNNLINKELAPGVYLMNIEIVAIDGSRQSISSALHVW